MRVRAGAVTPARLAGRLRRASRGPLQAAVGPPACGESRACALSCSCLLPRPFDPRQPERACPPPAQRWSISQLRGFSAAAQLEETPLGAPALPLQPSLREERRKSAGRARSRSGSTAHTPPAQRHWRHAHRRQWFVSWACARLAGTLIGAAYRCAASSAGRAARRWPRPDLRLVEDVAGAGNRQAGIGRRWARGRCRRHLRCVSHLRPVREHIGIKSFPAASYRRSGTTGRARMSPLQIAAC